MSFRSEIVSFCNTIGDGDMAYEVIVDPRPISAYQGSAQLGDLYVRLPAGYHDSASIYVYSEDNWIVWDPEAPLALVIMDVDIFSSPCAIEGFAYVASRDEVSTRSRNAPTDMPTLASLLATRIGVPVPAVPCQPDRTSTDLGAAAQRDTRHSAVKRNRKAKGKAKGKAKAKATNEMETAMDVDMEVDMMEGEKKSLPNSAHQQAEPVETAGDLDMNMLEAEEERGNVPDCVPEVENIQQPSPLPTVPWAKQDRPTKLDDNALRNEEPEYSDAEAEQATRHYYRIWDRWEVPAIRSRRLSLRSHGVVTRVPWTCQKDINAARAMASAPSALQIPVCQADDSFFVDTVQVGSRGTDNLNVLLGHLTAGRPVLAVGWNLDVRTLLNTVEISMHRAPLEQSVVWQDSHARAAQMKKQAALRDYSKMMVHGSLADFVAEAEKPSSRSWNCLDLPVTVQDVPPCIRYISDDQRALEATINQCYVTVDRKPTPGPSNLGGPQVIHFDNVKSSFWDVMTHGGFVTYPHHDAAGQLTYSYVRSGSKLWGYITLDGIDDGDQQAVLDAWERYYKVPMATDNYDKGVTIQTVLLEEHAVLIQPPGINHMVFTPEPTVMSGGHFYTYDTMHLTEFALAFDYGLDCGGRKKRYLNATNAVHPGMMRKIYRLVLALPYFSRSRAFYRRCLIAMRSILSIAQLAITKDEPDIAVIRKTDLLSVELAAERQAAINMMDRVMQHLGVTDAVHEIRQGNWRSPGPLVSLESVEWSQA